MPVQISAAQLLTLGPDSEVADKISQSLEEGVNNGIAVVFPPIEGYADLEDAQKDAVKSAYLVPFLALASDLVVWANLPLAAGWTSTDNPQIGTTPFGFAVLRGGGTSVSGSATIASLGFNPSRNSGLGNVMTVNTSGTVALTSAPGVGTKVFLDGLLVWL